MTCSRCNKDLTKNDKAFCWYCGAKLCEECNASFDGHCGHSQASSISENMKKIKVKDGE